MRRSYAFEADVSSEVKTQLEKVEDKVEEKCTTAEACDKMLDKISEEKEKFDDALQTMADKAKDCKDGKCDKAEMAAVITPKMAELKEVAKSIGVASEGDTLTEGELKDARDYLNGAEEIVEAKKDELSDSSEEPKDNDDDDDDNEEPEGAEEAFCALEAYADDLDLAIEGYAFDAAMEGANIDALKAMKSAVSKIRTAAKEMRAAKKAGDFKGAAAKANEAAAAADELASDCNNIPDSVSSTAIVTIALAVIAIAAGTGLGARKGFKFAAVQKAHRGANVAKAGAEAGKAAAAQFTATQAAGYDMMGGTAIDAARDAAKSAMRDATAASKKMARNTVLRNTGKGAAIGAGAGAAAAGAGASVGALSKFITQKKLTDADGDMNSEAVKKMGANDLNALISAIKIAAKNLSKHYKKLASKFASGQDAEATESAMTDATFDGFIAACEAFQFGTSAASSSPYLFD